MHHPIFRDLGKENWNLINWEKVELTILRMQHRITKAAEQKQHRKRQQLQNQLVNSLSARLLAVRKVAQDNPGKHTPGIDGGIWLTPERKLQAALALRSQSKASPKNLKQVYRSKGDDKPKPRIPCLFLLGLQRKALWNLALLPAVEAQSDPHSYGFRPYRDFVLCARHANAQIRRLLSKPNSPRWILNATIEKCFDTVYHDWLLENTPMDHCVLKSWLKLAYFEGVRLYPTEPGTTQDDIISPTLANFVLNGLEKHIGDNFKPGYERMSNGLYYRRATMLNIVRYADDFMVTGQSPDQLERVKASINVFLKPRGLKLSETKTHIINITTGFDFLGWTFRKYPNGAFLCTISKKSIRRHWQELNHFIKTTPNPARLIHKLNQKTRVWQNYHCCCNDIWKVWANTNQYIYQRLTRWATKRHSKKSKWWIYNKYWPKQGKRRKFIVTWKDKAYKLQPHDVCQNRTGSALNDKTNVFDLKNKA